MFDWITKRLPSAGVLGSDGRAFRLLPAGDSWILEEDGRDYVYRGTRSAVAIRFLERLNELACFTNSALTVHSGLVADGTGRAIWIPAASGGGKSTLTAQLALSGLRYATDEVVLVNEDGELTGWPKWLSLKRGSHRVLPTLAPESDDPIISRSRWMVPPSALGEIVEGPVVAGVVVFPDHRSGAPTEVDKISKAQAVVEIAPQAFNLRRWGVAGIEALASAVARSHVCVRITYSDGWEASQTLLDVLRSGVEAASVSSERPVV